MFIVSWICFWSLFDKYLLSSMKNIKQALLLFAIIITIAADSAEEDKVYVLDHVNYTHDYYSGTFTLIK